jgi:phage portal protein BeeE
VTSLLAHARRGFSWPFPSQGFESFNYGGQHYFGTTSSYAPDREAPAAGFTEMVDGPFRSNSIVFACELKRLSIFSEARFIWRGFNAGRPGRMFSTRELDILERPWSRGTTGDLLARMILDADMGGNAFVARTAENPDQLRTLRPDWVTIVMGDPSGRPVESAAQIDAEILGFIYAPQDGQTDPEALTAAEVAHWAPIPDPLARFRGMSWLTAAIREIQADQAATMHKLGFFENGATPQMVVTFDATVTEDQFKTFVSKMDDTHAGWRNAYKTLYLGGGATPTVVGKDLKQLDFSNTQGKGETRIVAAAGLHPVMVPSSEGMQGSSLNAGNYGAARRSVADTTFRPLWRNVAGSLAPILDVPSGSELWYDDQNIPFLREDAEAAAKIEQIKAETITKYVREGFTEESAVAAVNAQDVTLLEHTGLVSVQLRPPGEVGLPGTGGGSPAPPVVSSTPVSANGGPANG